MKVYQSILTALAIVACFVTIAGHAVENTPEQEKNARACRENLGKIDGSKEQFALEYRLPMGAAITWQNLLDPDGTGQIGKGYLRKKPVCGSGGTYSIQTVGKDPTCSIGTAGGSSETRTSETLNANNSQTTGAMAHVLL